MTVSSNYSYYNLFAASDTSQNMRPEKPDFEMMAQEMLAGMDSDGDSVISADEFVSALSADSGLSAEEGNALFSQLDTDSSSSLSTQELATALEAMGPPKHGQMPPPPPPPASSEEDSETETTNSSTIFSSLDTDGDGVISQSEFDALFASDEAETVTSTDDTAETKDNMYSLLLQRLIDHYSNDTETTSSTLNLSA